MDALYTDWMATLAMPYVWLLSILLTVVGFFILDRTVGHRLRAMQLVAVFFAIPYVAIPFFAFLVTAIVVAAHLLQS